MDQIKTITMFQVIIVVLLIFLVPFVLQEAQQIRSVSSPAYGYEIIPHLLVFSIGLLLMPQKTLQLISKNISINWVALSTGIIVFLLAWVPFTFWLGYFTEILPLAFMEHFLEMRFVIFLIGGLGVMKGLVNKEGQQDHSSV
ncbi:hypothetical protein [Evansella tamaricis]|uniref:Uncharacterized protein n=1 Tax=Evansella tamaricis TaxID=2069301 RepID=A0ABS6JPN5_9BACI|nr:hypothetical protein [Evansella tamaricis]MBU9714772.1 hypothetical protein [Evansella tamaricis]